MKIVAIPTEIADAVRATNKAPRYNHPAYIETAKGYGPCRHCLRTFLIGEEQRTLFTYDSFHGIEDLPLPGPVYIHTEACERYPENAGYPPELKHLPVVLNVYAYGPKLFDQIYADPFQAESHIEAIMANEQVAYIEVRDRKAGCFDFRVQRA